MHSRKTRYGVGLGIVVVAAGIGLGAAGAGGSGVGQPEGAWNLHAGGGLLREVFVPNIDGQSGAFWIRAVVPFASPFDSLFPGSEGTGAHGELHRVGAGTYRFRALSYRVIVSEDGTREVVGIRVDEGVAVFPDRNTQNSVTDVSFYFGDQDADGDGFPDPGEEPFLHVPGVEITGTRVY